MALQYPLFFVQRFKGKVLFNVPMSDYTTLRIGGPADVMVWPRDEGDLRDIITFAEAKNFQYTVIGGGANILVRDGGIRGIVINMSEGFKDLSWPGEEEGVFGSGVKLSRVSAECAKRGLSGFEFASGIPGTLGGAVAMNAGAFGAEMKDVVEGAEIMDRKGKLGFLSKGEIGFSYRRTALPEKAFIVRVHVRFKGSTPEKVREKMEEVASKRSGKSPTQPSAGSVFRNPEGTYAGRLIEEAGLKGVFSGGAFVSEVHANYIVNNGGAKATDVLRLMALIRDKVYSRTGHILEPEIKVIGED